MNIILLHISGVRLEDTTVAVCVCVPSPFSLSGEAKMPPRKCKECEKPCDRGCVFGMCLSCCSSLPSEAPDVECELVSHRLLFLKAQEAEGLRSQVAEMGEALIQLQRQRLGSEPVEPREASDGGRPQGPPRRPVASFVVEEEPEAPGRTGGLEASVAVLATQVEFMMAELRMIREGRPEVGRGDAAVEPEVGAVGDVAHRPSQWARVVAQGKTEAERQLKVDSLLLHIDRDHRVGELRSGGLPAQASARAMESIGTTLRAIAPLPGSLSTWRRCCSRRRSCCTRICCC